MLTPDDSAELLRIAEAKAMHWRAHYHRMRMVRDVYRDTLNTVLFGHPEESQVQQRLREQLVLLTTAPTV